MDYEDPHLCDVLGEFGPSLEDVTILNSLPLFRDAKPMGVTLREEDQKRLDFLNKALSDSRYFANKVTYLSLVKFSEES